MSMFSGGRHGRNGHHSSQEGPIRSVIYIVVYTIAVEVFYMTFSWFVSTLEQCLNVRTGLKKLIARFLISVD